MRGLLVLLVLALALVGCQEKTLMPSGGICAYTPKPSGLCGPDSSQSSTQMSQVSAVERLVVEWSSLT
jgi:hypothetical protein